MTKRDYEVCEDCGYPVLNGRCPCGWTSPKKEEAKHKDAARRTEQAFGDMMRASRERIQIYKKEHGDGWQEKLLDDLSFELLQSVKAREEANKKRRLKLLKEFGLDTIKQDTMPTEAEKLQRDHFLKTGKIQTFMTT